MRPLLLKLCGHAHDRMVERTPLPGSHVDTLQRSVDALGLPQGAYHLPLRHADGRLLGYAQFKGVSDRRAPVLATILSPTMTPRGSNIEDLLRTGGPRAS